jgi:hypothetical protein
MCHRRLGAHGDLEGHGRSANSRGEPTRFAAAQSVNEPSSRAGGHSARLPNANRKRLSREAQSPSPASEQRRQVAALGGAATGAGQPHATFPGLVHHIWPGYHRKGSMARQKEAQLFVNCLQSWSPQKQIVWVFGQVPVVVTQQVDLLSNCELRDVRSEPRLARRVAMYSPLCRERAQLLKEALMFEMLYQHGGLYAGAGVMWLGRPLPQYNGSCFVANLRAPQSSKQLGKKMKLISFLLMALPQFHPLALKMTDVCWGAMAAHLDAVSTRQKGWLARVHNKLVFTKSVRASFSLSRAVFPTKLLLPFPRSCPQWPPPAASDAVSANLTTIGTVSCTMNGNGTVNGSLRAVQGAWSWCCQIRREVEAEFASVQAAAPWLEQCRPSIRAFLGTSLADGLLGDTIVAIAKHPFLRNWWVHSPHILASLALLHQLSRVSMKGHLWEIQTQEARGWLLACLDAEEQSIVLQEEAQMRDSFGGLLP